MSCALVWQECLETIAGEEKGPSAKGLRAEGLSDENPALRAREEAKRLRISRILRAEEDEERAEEDNELRS